MSDLVFSHFKESSDLIIQSADVLNAPIAEAIDLVSTALINGNKILACGNGGSAADAQHFAAELMGRFEMERNPFPAVSLTTDTSILTAVANDYDYDQVFARQVQGLGRRGDILLAITTSGNSDNVLSAVQTAQNMGMQIVALTGREGGELAHMIRASDCHICVPHDRTARIQEVHTLIIHCISEGVDLNLYGDLSMHNTSTLLSRKKPV